MDDTVIGFIFCAIAVTGFSVMFVPIKPYEMKDGFFVMYIQSNAIMVVGSIINIIQGFPEFRFFGMLGGMIWATGNICTVPIINMLGSGLGIMIWGSVQIITGWATARFGWFGLKTEPPKSDLLEYTGVALTLLSAFVFVMVQPNAAPPTKITGEEEDNKLESAVERLAARQPVPEAVNHAVKTKIFAVILSIFAGFCFGETLTPITYIEENGASPHGLDHAFSFSAGAVFASTLYFIMYCIWQNNRPYINKRIMIPAFIYGTFWAIANFSWFVASEKISQSISFPIITRMPGVVASLIGVLIFKEIQGIRNYLVMTVAVIVAVTGVVLVGLSSVIET